VQAGGTVEPVTVEVQRGTLRTWPGGPRSSRTDDRPEPLVGVVRTESGVAHLRELAALGAPPLEEPRSFALRLARRGPSLVEAVSAADPAAGPDLELRPGTRWPGAVRVDAGTTLTVTGLLLARALGPSDGWWEPGTWHDEPAVGLRSWNLAAVDPDDVRNLHTLAVVADGTGPCGTLETLVLGPLPALGLDGFTAGAATP
jgi:hypothetical protein